jgi:hypothetical protein
LAPTWRELGKEFEGVVGIGAVNCREQWGICQNMQIRAYPTLLFFHEKGIWVDMSQSMMLIQETLRACHFGSVFVKSDAGVS